ncbi:hypothetical protein [Pseudodesulfovibrio sp.]|uniref:hypothetical protein n=1 Tax=unclassified Pseudodesulfovibrio TaxID=2661612 RepID=UPI003AFFD263
MNIGEWPIIGPVRIDSDNFLMRVVVLEVDSQENKQISEALNLATNVAGAATGANPLVKQVAQESLDLLITMNTDDIVLDERFGLRRKQNEGWDYNHTPLLTGTYVILQQEDRLQGSDVVDYASSATYPPNIDRMFFDTHSKNLYRAYHYLGDAPIRNVFASKKDYYQVEQSAHSTDYAWSIDEILQSKYGKETMDTLFKGLTIDTKDKTEAYSLIDKYKKSKNKAEIEEQFGVLLQHITAPAKMKYRSDLFGYPEGYEPIANNVTGMYDDTLLTICRDSYRGDWENDDKCQAGETLHFEFPVEVAPKANMALVQYPLHTHIIICIERVSGIYQEKYHDLYKAYDEYLETNFKPLLGDKFNKISETMTNMKTAGERINICFEKVDSEEDLAPKVEHLQSLLQDMEKSYQFSGPDNPVVSPVYMKLYRLTGTWYRDAKSIKPSVYKKFSFKNGTLSKVGSSSKAADLRPLLTTIKGKSELGIPVTEALQQISSKVDDGDFGTPEDFEKYLKNKYIKEQFGDSNNTLIDTAQNQGTVDAVDFFIRVVERADAQYPVAIELDDYIKPLNKQLKGYRVVTVADAKQWAIEQHDKEIQQAQSENILETMAAIRKNIASYIDEITLYATAIAKSQSYPEIKTLLDNAEAQRSELDTITELEKAQVIEQDVGKLKQEAQEIWKNAQSGG